MVRAQEVVARILHKMQLPAAELGVRLPFAAVPMQSVLRPGLVPAGEAASGASGQAALKGDAGWQTRSRRTSGSRAGITPLGFF